VLKGVRIVKYIKTQMKQLVKENRELQIHLKDLMQEHELEKNFALKALYHSEVADGGKYQNAYQALDLPKG
jgi:regulator of replication initiation timing